MRSCFSDASPIRRGRVDAGSTPFRSGIKRTLRLIGFRLQPLKTSMAWAYRPGMSRLLTTVPPNPRLQRTRLRAPLSPKPLGDPERGTRRREGLLLRISERGGGLDEAKRSNCPCRNRHSR
jgi:hypothetical protein